LVLYRDTDSGDIGAAWETRNAGQQPQELYKFDPEQFTWDARNAPQGTNGNSAALQFDAGELEASTMDAYAADAYQWLQAQPERRANLYTLVGEVDRLRADKGLGKLAQKEIIKLLDLLLGGYPVRRGAEANILEAVA